MNWESLISGILGVVSTLLVFVHHIGVYKEKIKQLEKLIDKVNILEKQVAALQEFQRNAPQIFIGKSPIGLTIYAENLLELINFEEFFKDIKKKLKEELDKMQLKTRYDVQEKSKQLLQQLKDDDMFIPLKTEAYERSKDYEHIMLAASIPLRDYYLSIHPEIKD